MKNKCKKQTDYKENVQKKIGFRCRKCGALCMIISGSDLKNYQRVWELLELLKLVPLSDAQITEYVALCEQGYRYVGMFCPNIKCDGEFDKVIMNQEKWEEQSKYAEVGYEIKEKMHVK